MRTTWRTWEFPGSAKVFRILFATAVMLGLAGADAQAQCGVNNIFTGDCVDLVLAPTSQPAAVGDIVEVVLLAKSVNNFGQPIESVGAILDWDEQRLELVGHKTCKGGLNSGLPCFTNSQCGVGIACSLDCEAGETPNCYNCLGSPSEYNWVSAAFANDEGLDGLNNDCGPATFCTPFTARPFNDGEAIFKAFKQFVCGSGVVAPAPLATQAGLVVGRFRFRVLVGGGQIRLKAFADCQDRQMVCVKPSPTPGLPCTVDADCGTRVCSGGDKTGVPCVSDTDCLPFGLCPVLCTACERSNCCIEEDTCPVCSFSETRVIGGGSVVADVTNSLGGPVTVGSGCVPPTVLSAGPRYLHVTPAAGPDSVALEVIGVEADVACVSGWVGSNGAVTAIPFFQSPAAWGTVAVRGVDLVSSRTYEVRSHCDLGLGVPDVSDPASDTLWKRGDVDNNNVVDISDIVRVLDVFRQFLDSSTPCTFAGDCLSVAPNFSCNVLSGSCRRVIIENADLIGATGCLPEGVDAFVDILDIVQVLNAFASLTDECPPPCVP